MSDLANGELRAALRIAARKKTLEGELFAAGQRGRYDHRRTLGSYSAATQLEGGLRFDGQAYLHSKVQPKV
jgi:hypothetical protein